jgi:hypothetical protein
MAGLVPAIHDFWGGTRREDVDTRDIERDVALSPRHDGYFLK